MTKSKRKDLARAERLLGYEPLSHRDPMVYQKGVTALLLVLITLGALIMGGFIAMLLGGLLLIVTITSLPALNKPWELESYKSKSLPQKPFVVLDRVIAEGASVVKFGEQRQLMMKLTSMPPPQHQDGPWLERLPEVLRRQVQVIYTSGARYSHKETGDFQFLLALDLSAGEDPNDVLKKAVEVLNAYGLHAAPVPDSIFDTHAAHGWSVTHYFAQRIFMSGSPAQLFANTNLGTRPWTGITTLKLGKIGDDSVLQVAFDLYVFTEGPPGLFGPFSERLRLKKARFAPLNFGGAFVAPPVLYFNRYACKPVSHRLIQSAR